MIVIIDRDGDLISEDGSAKPGQIIFNVWKKDSGTASVTIEVSEDSQIALYSETGCRNGGNNSSTWANHSLYVHDITSPGISEDLVDSITKSGYFKDWNGVCKGVRVFKAGRRYRIYGLQRNLGPTVINTNVIGTMQNRSSNLASDLS